jgi:RNA polymerase sigma-54 factor
MLHGVKPQNRTTLTTTQRLALNLSLAASIRVLRQDAVGLALYLDEQAAANPHLKLEAAEPAPGEWLPRWQRAFAAPEPVAAAAAAGPSLTGHVLAAVGRMFPPGPGRKVALVFVQALEPSGWLGRPLEALAREAGVPLAQAEAMLRQLQRIEPVGLFARNLAECLELQLAEAGWLDAPMRAILSRLDLVAAGDTGRLARLAGVDAAGVQVRLRRIRTLDPKPGTQFEVGTAPVREPDLVLSRDAQGWHLALNRSALPAVSVDAAARGGSEAALAAARDIRRQVEARGATILRVGQAVLRRQAAALVGDRTALVPMTMAEVAEETGLHVSTVSRAVAGAAVDTPAGTFWLRHFFSQGLRHRTGDPDAGPAAAALRAEIARLVAAEDAAAPLSDAALAAALATAFGGAPPARRTVAKYRAMLAIPPAARRRRRG